jgi:pyruvate/2-oxoglutarate dehydrogenase complex dihydrolipoamide acyltransferase (E2) component
LGYDYCLREECQQRFVKRVRLAALGVNKAADYYVRADEVLPPPAPAPVPPGPEEGDEPAADRDGASRASPGPKATASERGHSSEKWPPSTLERLRQREAELDEALAQSYERFRRNEITAREMEAEQRRLVAEFNQLVMSENIRYRSLLRRRPS